MTIRDLAHLLLTARDLDQDVKISSGGYKSHITRVEFVENGGFVVWFPTRYKDMVITL